MNFPHHRFSAIAMAAVATISFAACSKSEEDHEAEIREQFAEIGLSTEAADCAIDHLQNEQGLKLTDIAGNEDDYAAELGAAGQACITEADLSDADPDAISEQVDLKDDEAARTGFITEFANASGLSEEVGECVLDGLLDEGFSSGEIVQAGTEVITATEEIVTGCME